MGFPGDSVVKNLPDNEGDTGSIPWLGRSVEKGILTHSSTGKFRGQRSLEGYSPWGYKGVRHDLMTKQQQTKHAYICVYVYIYGLPWWLSSKESVWNARHLGSIPGLGRSPEVGGNGNPLQYSCLENPTDRGAWQAAVRRVAQSLTQLKRLSTHTHTHTHTHRCH